MQLIHGDFHEFTDNHFETREVTLSKGTLEYLHLQVVNKECEGSRSRVNMITSTHKGFPHKKHYSSLCSHSIVKLHVSRTILECHVCKPCKTIRLEFMYTLTDTTVKHYCVKHTTLI